MMLGTRMSPLIAAALGPGLTLRPRPITVGPRGEASSPYKPNCPPEEIDERNNDRLRAAEQKRARRAAKRLKARGAE